MRCISRSSAATALVIFILLFASACAVPLSPAYRILKESREVRFVAGTPPELQIAARFTLMNSGNSALTFIDVIFPGEHAYGRKELHVKVDGREVTPVSLPSEYQAEQPNALRVPLDPPWERKQSRELAIDYVFASPQDSGFRITLGESDFHLGSRGWFPLPQPPKHVLSPYPRRPNRLIYTVRVPSDFLLIGRGSSKGARKDGGELEYRFELRKEDMPPFVVGGRYTEWPAKPTRQSASFWTHQPLTGDLEPVADRILDAWKTLETDFGPIDKKIAAPHVVESPEVHWQSAPVDAPAATSFPGGVLVNSAALSLGVGSERFLEIVTHALARNWFGDEMYPAPDAALGIGEGLPEYATIVVEEARNGPSARRQRVQRYLREYDEAAQAAVEKPLGQITMSDSPSERNIALAKAALFYVALEDDCGETAMRSGLAHLVSVLRGQEASYDALRSALEQSSGGNLAAMFRVWLNEKGIPKEFRDRYQP